MRRRVGAVAGMFLLCAACASTRVAATWTNPKFAGKVPKKVLVVADVPSQAVRHQLEERLAQELSAAGVVAVPLARVESAGRRPQKEAVREALQTKQFDGLVVSRVVGSSEEVRYSPDGYWYGPSHAYGGPYGYMPGYWDWDVVHATHLETTLYEADPNAAEGQEELVWSGASSTFASGLRGMALNDRDIAHFTKVIAQRLTEDLKG